MLTTEPTIEMIQEWKCIYNENRDKLKPNRKSGAEINDYFCNKYRFEKLDSLSFHDVVEFNIMKNESNREKLPQGAVPQIVAYKAKDSSVLVGIDLVTGFFHIEGKDITSQAELVMKNVGALLAEAGTDYTKVVKTTCFLADMADFAAFNEVYAKYFTEKPARSCVAVKTLPKNVLCEVEVIAAV